MDGNNPPPRPGNYDRSWNDPPLFSYASGTPNSTGNNKLNKRVEFPSLSNNSNLASGIMPPVNPEGPPGPFMCAQLNQSSNTSVPPPIVMTTNEGLKESISNKPLQMLPYDYKNTSNPNKSLADCDTNGPQKDSSADIKVVIADFNVVLDSAQSEMDQKKLADIKKRISLMEGKWKSGSLNAQMENGLAKMARCLLDAQVTVNEVICAPDDPNLKVKASSFIDEAERIQRSLMVDWSSLCGTWMIGIKHLVLEVKRILIVKGELVESTTNQGIEVPL